VSQINGEIEGIGDNPSAESQLVRPQLVVLPALPHAVSKLLEVTLDDEASMALVADLAGKDPALTAQMLRLANSPLFGGVRSISSLSQATVILGLQTVQNIAVSLCVYESFSDRSSIPGFSIGSFWWHSLATAICSRLFGVHTRYESPEEAFVAGLVHDLGQLILIGQSPENYEKVLEATSSGRPLVDAEKRLMGVDHAQAGADLLAHWRLKPLVCDAVRYHHQPVSEIGDATELVRIVFLANRFCHYLIRPPGTAREDMERLAEGLLGLRPQVLDELQQSIFLQVNEAATFLGMKVAVPDEGATPERADGEEERCSRALRKKGFDHSLLVGTLETMLSARSEEDLFETFIRSMGVLFDFQSVFLLRLESSETLKGVSALGSRDDGLAAHMRIRCSPGSIWESAFSASIPVHYQQFFRDGKPRAIDTQVASLLGGPYLLIPVACGGERIGLVAVGIPLSEWEGCKGLTEPLLLLARQLAQPLRINRYRGLLAREHSINAAILESAPVGILLVNKEGNTFYWNPSARRMLGHAWVQAPPKRFNLWKHLGLNEQLKTQILQGAQGDKVGELEVFRWKSPAGQTRWLHIKAVQISMPDFQRALVLLEDVTFEHLLETERRQQTERLKEELAKRTDVLKKIQSKIIEAERLSASGELARKVAHEVNNPLGIIKNCLKILRLDDISGKVASETVTAIEGEIDRIAGIIRQLVTSAQPLLAGEKVELPGNVYDVLKDIAVLMERSLKDRGIVLDIETGQSLPPVRLSDDGLKQVLINLIKNSEDALAGPGKILVRARLDYDYSGDLVIIEVADTGPGIDPEIRERLFEPFVTTKGIDNSGLGLSVCSALVKAAGGSISVTESEGWGAVFEVRLPTVRE
jgi:PAS domain S-box-containing protein